MIEFVSVTAIVDVIYLFIVNIYALIAITIVLL